MPKAQLVITAVTLEGRTQADVARAYGVSKGWVSKLVVRCRQHGEAAFALRLWRPHRSPHRVILLVQDRDICIVDPSTGELLRHLTLDPTRDDQPTGAPIGPKPETKGTKP